MCVYTYLKEGKVITKMSDKLINRQIKFMAHLLRSEENDIMKTCTVDNNGFRITAGFKRTGCLESSGMIR